MIKKKINVIQLINWLQGISQTKDFCVEKQNRRVISNLKNG